MTPVTIQGLVKDFGSTRAVDHIALEIKAGDLFFLLGPSGCGKTTLLRMLAGFTDPTSGVIRFGDRDVTHQPPSKRHTGMVFQGYALWPHMTVYENVAFGLDVRKVSAADKKRRVEKALATVQMSAYAQRKPNELSGGQQQRVALARALVIEPTVLLLDEPLSNLDAKLRLDMRSQIRQICKSVGITAIYVTHDQKEAMSMADNIAVLRDGRVIQTGPPRQLYERPESRFVADFLGETNFISAVVTRRDQNTVWLDSSIGTLCSTAFPDDLPNTGNVTCSIRPEALRLVDMAAKPEVSKENYFHATRLSSTYLGEMAQYQLQAGVGDDAMELKVFELNPKHLPGQSDERLDVTVAAEDVVILRD